MPTDDPAENDANTPRAPRKIVLGVSGGIAAYKAADLCSRLVKAGAEVRVAFSANADKFIAPLTFEALSGHRVYGDIFNTSVENGMEHISWARWADALVVAPATADAIARLATGRADDAISAMYLAFSGAVYVAPAMNTVMWEHAATQANVRTLCERGAIMISPGEGVLACGEVGAGRMAEPLEIMQALGFDVAEGLAAPHGWVDAQAAQPGSGVRGSVAFAGGRSMDHSLDGKTVLITSGPTREFLDPVRFISSPSSGRMGMALAEEALRRGATVHFVTGPVDDGLLPRDVGGRLVLHRVQSAREMLQAAESLKAQCELFIFAAAVGDFRPSQIINRKIKRSGNSISLPLVENPDIAQAIGFSKGPGQVLIGFAAESDDHLNNAQAKIAAKRLDAVVLNDISNPEIGFGSGDNEVVIITAEGDEKRVERGPKADIAFEVLSVAHRLLGQAG